MAAGQFSDMDLSETCPDCGKPLSQSPGALPVPKFTTPALITLIIGLFAWIPLVAIMLISRAPERPSIFGVVVITFAICGYAYRMPRVRMYRCRECKKSVGIPTDWRR